MRIATTLTAAALALTVLLLLPNSSEAGKPPSSKPKTVHAQGYVRRNGTYVKPYDRSAPSKTPAVPRSTSLTPPVVTPRRSASPGSASRPIVLANGSALRRSGPVWLRGTKLRFRDSAGRYRTYPLSRINLAASGLSRCETCQRDRYGKILRSAAARQEFMRQSGFPKGRSGYVVDHIQPLECGGADAPENMQWQTIAAAKQKDKAEFLCRR